MVTQCLKNFKKNFKEATMSEERDDLIILTDDDGNEESYSFLDLIEYDGCEYVVLYPEREDNDGTVEILRVEDLNEEEDAYLPVDSEEVLNAVFELFKEKNKDDFDFE
jgi:uncharacterized protein YrzB (UPF0473 family)